jgi:hypothetical protein
MPGVILPLMMPPATDTRLSFVSGAYPRIHRLLRLAHPLAAALDLLLPHLQFRPFALRPLLGGFPRDLCSIGALAGKRIARRGD